jgi:hypothetical protein
MEPPRMTYNEYTIEINRVERELGRLFMDLDLDDRDAGYHALYEYLGQLYADRQ